MDESINIDNCDLVVLFARENNNASRFFSLLKEKRRVGIKEIKQNTSDADFSRIILHDIYDLNNTIKIIDPSKEFLKPCCKRSGSIGPVLTDFELNDGVSMDYVDDFFILLLKRLFRY